MQVPETLQRFDWQAGYPSTVNTLQLMAKTLRSEYLDPRLRLRARRLFAGLPSLDHDAEIAALWAFMLEHVRYMRDPVGVEYVTSALELDKEIDDGLAAEDCEGVSLYAATVLAAAGIASQFEIMGWDPAQPKKFKHCALHVLNPRTKKGTSFDLVGAWEYPGKFRLGDTLHRAGCPLERWNLDGEKVSMANASSFFEPSDDDDSLFGGAFGDAPAPAPTGEQQAGDILNQVKGAASQFGPYGQIVAGVVQVGESIYEAATGKHLGTIAPPVRVPPPPPAEPKSTLPSWLGPVAIAVGAVVVGREILK